MKNCTFVGAWVEDLELKNFHDIYIKNGPRIEGKTHEEVYQRLYKNRSHLITFPNGKNLHHNLGCPVWFDRERIIIYVFIPKEAPQEKGIAV